MGTSQSQQLHSHEFDTENKRLQGASEMQKALISKQENAAKPILPVIGRQELGLPQFILSIRHVQHDNVEFVYQLSDQYEEGTPFTFWDERLDFQDVLPPKDVTNILLTHLYCTENTGRQVP